MSSQMKMIVAIGAVLIAGAVAFRFLFANKPPAPPSERGYHPPAAAPAH